MIPHISTVNGISLVLNGRPVHVSRTDQYYEQVLYALQTNQEEGRLLEIIEGMKRKVEKFCALTPTLRYEAGTVTYCGRHLNGYAAGKLVALVEAGHSDVQPLALFLDRLQRNPSNQTITHLYQFLEYGNMPITERGTFLAYKAVREDFKDIHSGKFDNTIGSVLEMPRRNVDDRRDVTCSYGFHVCSFEYLPYFAGTNGHVMVCEVDPADVVSIPNDYNNTKMRVCKYKVIGEVEDYYDECHHVLGDMEVWDESYSAEVLIDDEWNEWASFDKVTPAIEYAVSLIGAEDDITGQTIRTVRVINSSGVVMFERG
jgi:hypothetical protein